MKNRLLAAVAAFAFVATGVAYAQENPRKEQPATPQRVERPAPAAERSREVAPRAAQVQPREESRAAQAQPREEPRAAQAQPREEPKREAAPRAAQMQPREEPKRDAEPRALAPKAVENDRNGMNKDEPRTGVNDQQRQPQRNANAEAARPKGQISKEHAQRLGQLLQRNARPQRFNGPVRVGVQVPEDVRVYPVPGDVVAIEPEYSGYDYFLDSNNEIVFVSPDSHEVVGVVDFEGRAASEDPTQVVGARPCPVEN